MTERREFEMTQAELDELLSAMKRLGNKIGFDHMTVRPNGKGDRFFTAIPKEPTP